MDERDQVEGRCSRPEPPIDLSVVTSDGRVAIEVRNNGTAVVLDLDVIAGFDHVPVVAAHPIDAEYAPIDRLGPGESATLVVDDCDLGEDGLTALVAFFCEGRTHRLVKRIAEKRTQKAEG